MTEHRRTWNPIKRGWVRRVTDWPRSSFHAFSRRGIYSQDWGGEHVPSLAAGSNASDAVPFVHRILHGLGRRVTWCRGPVLNLLPSRRLSRGETEAQALLSD